VEKVNLNFNVKHHLIPALAKEKKTKAKQRLVFVKSILFSAVLNLRLTYGNRFLKMDAEDAARRDREEALNNLEAYIYSSKDFLTNDDVIEVTTEEQRETFTAKLDEAEEWMYDSGSDAKTDEFRSKLKALKDLRTPIALRRDELEKRPTAAKSLREGLTSMKDLIESMKPNMTLPEEPLWTEEDVKGAFKVIADIEKWLTEKEEAQSKLEKHVTPVFTSQDVEKKRGELDKEVIKLISKKPKKKPIKPKTTTSTSTTSSKAAQETGEAKESEGGSKDGEPEDEKSEGGQSDEQGESEESTITHEEL
jgi:hypothetical protein